jgi:tRNA(Ile)-lysidine synthase
MARNRTFQKALGCFKSALKGLPEISEHQRNFFIGVSGGADSLALAAVSSVALKSAGAAHVTCIIVDHGLQEGSDKVALNAKRQCESLGLRAKVKQASLTPGSNLEARARDARYRLLKEDAHPGDVLLLAHTLNDQAENVLLGLVRGSGLSALHGMKTISETGVSSRGDALLEGVLGENMFVVRPFLDIRRQETEEICRTQKLSWWNDPTNTVEELSADPTLKPSVNHIIAQYPLRSQVRSLLMPHFEALAPGVQQNLARTAELSRIDDDFLWEEAAKELESLQSSPDFQVDVSPAGMRSGDASSGEGSSSFDTLPLEYLRKLDLSLRYRVLALWLGHPAFERIREINRKLVEIEGVGGRVVELAGGVQVVREGVLLRRLQPKGNLK